MEDRKTVKYRVHPNLKELACSGYLQSHKQESVSLCELLPLKNLGLVHKGCLSPSLLYPGVEQKESH